MELHITADYFHQNYTLIRQPCVDVFGQMIDSITELRLVTCHLHACNLQRFTDNLKIYHRHIRHLKFDADSYFYTFSSYFTFGKKCPLIPSHSRNVL